jgi:hypothetical protein
VDRLGAALAELAAGGVPVGTYHDGSALDPTLAPRPFLHPLRTLAGTVVTDCLPEDHRWHLGVSVAVPDVGGRNFWGGRTYVRGEGYQWREDHGRIRHLLWRQQSTGGFIEQLLWEGPDGVPLLAETRTVLAGGILAGRVTPLRGPAAATPARGSGPPPEDRFLGWVLELTFRLENVTGEDLAIGSPTSNGRESAAYGGFFWRLPRPRGPLRVSSAAGEGEEAVHGRPADTLTVAGDSDGRPYTLTFAGADEVTGADPWFVRVAGYPGVGSSLAPGPHLRLAPGASLQRHVRVDIRDGGP